MKVLVDTHVFLWLGIQQKSISSNALHTLNQASVRYMSIASVWEMQIKLSLGKLPLAVPLPRFIEEICQQNSTHILPITPDHIYRLADLPPIHGDPFDRMLIAQAQHEGLTLVTADEKIMKYAVQTAW